MKRITVTAFSLILALTVLLSGCSTGNETDSSVKISTQLVKKGDLQIGVYADGRITIPVTRVNFAISGMISSVLVEPGQTVRAGDLLAELDNTDILDAIADAETNLLKAQVAYDDAVRTRQYTLDSEKIKLDSLYFKYVSFFDDDDYEETIEDAKETVEDKEIALNLAEETLTEWLIQRNEQSEPDGETDSSEDSSPSPTPAQSDEDLDAAISIAQQAVDEAKAELAAAQADLQTALASLSSTFERDDFAHTAAREAYNLQYLKVENLIASTASIVNAESNLAEAEKKLSEANTALDQTKLYAPIAGKVLEIAFVSGDDVQARTSATSGTPDFMTLYDPANVQLVANVNEGDISGLEVGQNLRITVDALYLENQAGIVTNVSMIPKIDNTGIVTYAVTGSLEKPDERILDGMSVFVLFLKKEKTDVLLVPNKAIFMVDGRQHVHVQLADGVIEKRAVVLGLTNGTQSEVIEGLAAGENVVTGGVDR